MMKKIILLLILISTCITTGCEDVINVDLNNAAPKLVIEAAINWKKGTSGTVQTIKLSTTTGFYDTKIPKVSGATVTIKNSANTIFVFTETGTPGEYVCTNFNPVLNETYTLNIINKGATYTATETLKPVASITKIVQNDKGGFTGNNKEIKTFYQDPSGIANYYLYKYSYSNKVKADYYVDQDEFFNGNEFFSISQNDELKKGDLIEVTHIGISKAYYNYMSVLVSIAGNNGGGPFQAPPATVRGNIINSTTPENYPLGYFSLSETEVRNYTVE
jgi:hypothetical protein